MDSAKTKSMLNRTNSKLNGNEEVDKGTAFPTCSIMYSIVKKGVCLVWSQESSFVKHVFNHSWFNQGHPLGKM